MNKLIKRIIALNLLAGAVLYAGGAASASEFNLSSVSAAELRGTAFKAAQVPRPGVPKPAAGELVEMGLSIKIPFKAINKVMLMESMLSIIDPAEPVLERSGDLLKVVNIRLDVNGIIIEPVITLKPYLEGKDRLAVRVQRVQMHAAGSPTPGSVGVPVAIPAPATGPDFNMEDTMADIMDLIISGIRRSITESLAASQSTLTSRDLINSNYDKTAWTLHTVIAPSVLKRFLPEGMVGDIHMTGFSFNNNALLLKLESEQ